MSDEALYKLLEKLKTSGPLTTHQLTSEEIRLAEELVYRKLISKISTPNRTLYYYGVLGSGEYCQNSQRINLYDKKLQDNRHPARRRRGSRS